MIYIGTSGFSYADWKEVFYPPHIKKQEMFSYYIKYFNSMEINFSFYVLPRPDVYEKLISQAPINFKFIVKAFRGITHNYQNKDEESIEKFNYSLKPFVETNYLDGILLQFPFSFKYTSVNTDYLKYLRDQFTQDLFVEFRHRSWFKPEVFNFLKENHLYYCSVDEPNIYSLLPPALILTGNKAYIRFHSRDRKKWFEGEKERYNYRYSDKELLHWIKQLNRLSSKPRDTYVFFNNCHEGNAVINALRFKELLKKMPHRGSSLL